MKCKPEAMHMRRASHMQGGFLVAEIKSLDCDHRASRLLSSERTDLFVCWILCSLGFDNVAKTAHVVAGVVQLISCCAGLCWQIC
jgi:hypothetical protein